MPCRFTNIVDPSGLKHTPTNIGIITVKPTVSKVFRLPLPK